MYAEIESFMIHLLKDSKKKILCFPHVVHLYRAEFAIIFLLNYCEKIVLAALSFLFIIKKLSLWRDNA